MKSYLNLLPLVGACKSSYMMPKSACILVAHKIYPQLLGLIKDLAEIVNQEDIFIVDNGSDGLVLDHVLKEFPNVIGLRSKKNLHYCGGSNIGLRKARALGYKYGLLLNADLRILNPFFVSKLELHADRHPEVAFVGPRVSTITREGLCITQNTIYHFPSLLGSIHAFVRRIKERPGFNSSTMYDTCSVDYLNGVCVLVSLLKLNEIRYLNPKLGGYYEDADWAYRARKKGYYSHFIPIESVIHYQDHDEYCDYTQKCFMLRRNLIYFYFNHGMFISGSFYLVASLFILLIRALLLFSTGNIRKSRYYAYLIYRILKSFLSLFYEPISRSRMFGPPIGDPYPILNK